MLSWTTLGMAEWMRGGSPAIHGTRPVNDFSAHNSESPWIRWTLADDAVNAILAPDGRTVPIPSLPAEADPLAARWDGNPVGVTASGGGYLLDLGRVSDSPLPIVIRFNRKAS
jgi:hypothetical protein